MKTSIFMTLLGVGFVVLFNKIYFGYYFLELVWMIGCANLCVFSTLFFVLKMERFTPVNKILLGSITKAWLLFALTFSIQLVISCPILTNVSAFLTLLLPLVASGTLGVIPFGLIRDYQLKRRAAQSKHLVSRRI